MELLKRPKPLLCQQGVGRTAIKVQAMDVKEMLVPLGDKDKLPRFVVQSDDLERLQPLQVLGVGGG
jgi:hypothetical protein